MNELTPYLPSEQAHGYAELLKKMEHLHVASHALHAGLHPTILDEVAQGIALVNNYYSNLIESEGTHPIDISRAINKVFSDQASEQSKQRLSLAYRDTQAFVYSAAGELDFSSEENIRRVHECFYGSEHLLPEQLILTDDDGNRHHIVPGKVRETDVQVGAHIAPEKDLLPRLFKDFYTHYKYKETDLVITKLIKAFAAHHRYMFIHPFLDGNGRTGRLMTDGMLKQALPESYGLWSLSRGLARNNVRYKQFLARADQIRQGSTDGRGQRSESGLMEFVDFMVMTAIDQVEFMTSMLKLDRLHDRLVRYTRFSENYIPEEYVKLLPHFFIHGEIAKKDIPGILGYKERKSREVMKELKVLDLVANDGQFTPYRLRLSSEMLSFVFPGLIPESN